MKDESAEAQQSMKDLFLASKIEMIPTDELVPYDKNSRTHSEDQIAELASSITEFGFTNPVLKVKKDGKHCIRAGEGRWLASKMLGLPAVPCIDISHMSETQQRAYVIADNKLALNSGWDDDVLREEIMALEAEGFDLELVGFSDQELEDLELHFEGSVDGDKDDDGSGTGDGGDQEPKKLEFPGEGKGLSFKLVQGDCLKILKGLKANSADSLVTDPPAGISFMGKDWDDDKGGRDQWVKWLGDVMKECYRALKPGAHGLVWAIPRTSHWTATALENAGFEIRDVVLHLFGSGFPKSHDISKAIDRAAGAEGEIIRKETRMNEPSGIVNVGQGNRTEIERIIRAPATPATPAAQQWNGWGTALKPASEHWILVRKPISEGTVAKNVLKWGTGGLNIDGCRIEFDAAAAAAQASGMLQVQHSGDHTVKMGGAKPGDTIEMYNPGGRFPSNLVISCEPGCTEKEHVTECPATMLDEQSGRTQSGRKGAGWQSEYVGGNVEREVQTVEYGDEGGASRFFYCAKPSVSEKDAGLDGFESKVVNESCPPGSPGSNSPGAGAGRTGERRNIHPTVKPIALMRYFCRMVTPPGGTVLEPFTGSGTTAIGALAEGLSFVGCEKEKEYFSIAMQRIMSAFPKAQILK